MYIINILLYLIEIGIAKICPKLHFIQFQQRNLTGKLGNIETAGVVFVT